jgi:hypothetical protein
VPNVLLDDGVTEVNATATRIDSGVPCLSSLVWEDTLVG